MYGPTFGPSCLNYYAILLKHLTFPEGPTISALTVVRLYVRLYHFISRLANHFFLNFLHEVRGQKTQKVAELFFEKNSCCTRNGVNEAFLVPKPTPLSFSETVPDDRH